MKTSSALIKKAGIIPKLRLGLKLAGGGVKSLGPRRVTVVEDKVIKKLDPKTGKKVEWLRVILEEGGQRKYYDTRLRDDAGNPSYLVQRFAEVKEGAEIILEMKKQGIKNYIELIPTDNAHSVEVSDDEEYDEGGPLEGLPEKEDL